jgi:hypothetical protein
VKSGVVARRLPTTRATTFAKDAISRPPWTPHTSIRVKRATRLTRLTHPHASRTGRHERRRRPAPGLMAPTSPLRTLTQPQTGTDGSTHQRRSADAGGGPWEGQAAVRG